MPRSRPGRAEFQRAHLHVENLEAREQPAGIWTTLANPAPYGIGHALLLTDGTVMAHGDGSNLWYRLTPDATGNYINGTWSTLAPMSISRLYFGSTVLPSGNVLVVGGEYSGTNNVFPETNTAEFYDPVADTWTHAPNFPKSQFGDGLVKLLPDGRVLGGYLSGRQTYLYDPATNAWTFAANKLRNDPSGEEAWLKLSDSSVLSYDLSSANSGLPGHAQRYIPATNTWVDAGSVPVDLSDHYEIGPSFLLPDGRGLQFGDNGNCAYYTPTTNTWTAGPVVPNGLSTDDAPGAMMPDGHVLITAGSNPVNGGLDSPTSLFDFDPIAQTYEEVTPDNSIIDVDRHAYETSMLVLPTGQVLFCTRESRLAVYTPSGTPPASARPTVTAVQDNGDGTYTLTGTQLNGISEGAAFDDDKQMASNYPIVQLSDGSNVYRARTFNWMGLVATGNTPVSTDFSLPPNLPAGQYSLIVSGCGISSAPFDFTAPAPRLAVVASAPAGRAIVAEPPMAFTLEFSEPIDSPVSIPASVFQVNGTAATSVSFDASGTKATFTFSISPVIATGTQTMTLTADLLMGANGSQNLGYSNSFQYQIPMIITVISTADAGAGSLREALHQASLNHGLTRIHFSIPGSGVHTIQPLSSLPAISNPVVIDGTTQPGYAGTPLIELNGSLAPLYTTGLTINGNDTMVKGLAINQFSGDGIGMFGVSGCWIQGNFIGTNAAGTAALANGGQGISIYGGAYNNLIGTDGDGTGDAAERNLISGHTYQGILIGGPAVFGNRVAGNYIGTDVTGTLPIPNGNGVYVYYFASDNIIGTTGTAANTIGESNLISGNTYSAVVITGSGTDRNTVAGNRIGTDETGTTAVPNLNEAVLISGGARSNWIGTDGDGLGDANEGNLISGNSYRGVYITGAGTSFNVVAGNRIGTDATGTTALANGLDGIVLNGSATNNLIGTDGNGASDDLERNLISGNTYQGILIADLGTSHNVVAGNFIGTDVTGTQAIPNTGNGIYICNGATDELIGTDGLGAKSAGEANLISGNTYSAIVIIDAGTSGHRIAGNFIGTDIAGAVALPNHNEAIFIAGGAHANWIGTDGDGSGDANEGNLISGNSFRGVFMTGSGTSQNVVAGNRIGTNGGGTAALANGLDGIVINGGATDNLIGTDADGVSDDLEGNLISGNTYQGILIADAGTSRNAIAGNFIGTDITGTQAVPNGASGVYIYNAATNNLIGTDGLGVAVAAEGNLISANAYNGVVIQGLGTTGNVIAGNTIGSAIGGVLPLGNTYDGVFILDGANDNTVGGTMPGTGNALAGNGSRGVEIQAGTGNAVLGNTFNLNDSAIVLLNNANDSPAAPVLSMALSAAGMVTGTLAGSPNTAYRVEFFQSPAANQIEIYLGFANVSTNGSGIVQFSVSIAGLLVNQLVTATATDPSNNTSAQAGAIAVNFKQNQTVTWDNTIGPVTYGTTPIALAATSTSGLPVTFSVVSGPGLIDQGKLVVTGAGVIVVQATQPGDLVYLSDSIQQTVESLKAPLTVHGIVANDKIYDGTTSATFTTTGAGLSGVVGGDDATLVTSAITGSFAVPAVGNGIAVSVSGLTLTGANSSNYILAQPNLTTNITPATLTIRANDVASFVGKAIPPLTFTVSGLVPGESSSLVTGVILNTSATRSSPAGIYPINASGGIAANYQLAYVAGTLTLDPNAMLVGVPRFAVGPDSGSLSGGFVRIYGPDGSLISTIRPFPGTTGGIRTTMADFTGDGVPDLAVGTGPRTVAEVKILDGVSGSVVFDVKPFETFQGGVFVTAGDMTGDGKAELVITPDEGGGPRVEVFRGGDFKQIANFFGIDDPNFRGGARAAVNDVTADGFGDIVVSAGFGGGPRVSVFDGNALVAGQMVHPFGDFFIFGGTDAITLRNGVFIASGDVNGDGYADLIAGGGPGGGPRVLIVDGRDLVQNGPSNPRPIANFFAGDTRNRGGIRVSAKDLDGDSRADVVVGAGTGAGSRVTGYTGSTLTSGATTEAFSFNSVPGFNGGVFVG